MKRARTGIAYDILITYSFYVICENSMLDACHNNELCPRFASCFFVWEPVLNAGRNTLRTKEFHKEEIFFNQLSNYQLLEEEPTMLTEVLILSNNTFSF
jgi:hypothetical protein